jgi:hypothetical protein
MVAVVKICWLEVHPSITTEKFTTKSVQVAVACCAMKPVLKNMGYFSAKPL